MSILVLFDRLNFEIYSPKLWKPGNWFATNIDREISMFRRQKTLTFFKNIKPRHTIIATANKNKIYRVNNNKYIDSEYLMKNDIQREDYKAYEANEFGSNLYVIKTNNDRPIDKTDSSTPKTINSTQTLPPIEENLEEKRIKSKNSSIKLTKSSKTERNETASKKATKPKSKVVQFEGFETPMSYKTITTLANSNEKKQPLIVKSRLPIIEPTRENQQETQSHIYNDIIKNLHSNRRLINSSSVLGNSKKFNQDEFKLKKNRTVPAFSSLSIFNQKTKPNEISQFLSNNVSLKNKLFEKLNRDHVSELNFNTKTKLKTLKQKYTQSLDGFIKPYNKKKKQYERSNNFWNSIDKKISKKKKLDRIERFSDDSIDYGVPVSYIDSINNFNNYEKSSLWA